MTNDLFSSKDSLLLSFIVSSLYLSGVFYVSFLFLLLHSLFLWRLRLFPFLHLPFSHRLHFLLHVFSSFLFAPSLFHLLPASFSISIFSAILPNSSFPDSSLPLLLHSHFSFSLLLLISRSLMLFSPCWRYK